MFLKKSDVCVFMTEEKFLLKLGSLLDLVLSEPADLLKLQTDPGGFWLTRGTACRGHRGQRGRQLAEEDPEDEDKEDYQTLEIQELPTSLS